MEKKHNVLKQNNGIQNKIIFGGQGGSFTPLNNTGNQVVVFKGGTLLDSIQIGDNKYGGNGGSEAGRAVLPADGSFTLLKMQVNHSQCINYLEATINGNDVRVGTLDSTAATLNVNMQVTLSGINSGTYVDSLQFNIV